MKLFCKIKKMHSELNLFLLVGHQKNALPEPIEDSYIMDKLKNPDTKNYGYFGESVFYRIPFKNKYTERFIFTGIPYLCIP